MRPLMEKRLAVLLSVIDDKLSLREAVCVHGVSKGSIETWLREHRAGHRTIASLRAVGVVPAAPVGFSEMAHGPARFGSKLPDPLAETQVLIPQPAALLNKIRRHRQRLVEEREVVAARLKAINDALALIDGQGTGAP